MTAIAQAIFKIPPFPGSKPHVVVREANPAAGRAPIVTAAALVAAMRRDEIGGRFWTAASEAPTMDASDPNVLLTAIHGRPVRIKGTGLFAALSGLAPGGAETEQLIEAFVAQHLLTGVDYHDPFTGELSDPLRLVSLLSQWRHLIDSNRPIVAAFGFANWKRNTVDPLLWGGAPVSFLTAKDEILDDLPASASIAVWKARVSASFLDRLENGPWRLLEVEDGFIRSAGLGADCVPPLSIVVDDLGVHYDPSRPNRLEEMLAQGDFSTEDLARARDLRMWLVREGVSKYGVGAGDALPRPAGAKRHILVVGQVEDDRSVQFGGGAVQSNLELLRRVRALEPDAYLVYRPHPDVEAGHRRGAIPPRVALDIADAIEPSSPISALIAMVDEVHVMTSLAGFEALMHGKSVTTHGMPFFAGWGLTRDLALVPDRRNRQRTLDELTAAILLLYPRYLDPVTNLPCTAEILTMRLLSGVRRENSAMVNLRRFWGWLKRAPTHILGTR
jgi:capsular polysaccharide export protein